MVMSGFCAIYSRSGEPVDAGLLRRMTASMAHRGDAHGACCANARVGMGVSLLACNEPRNARPGLVSPLHWRSGRCWVAADARIDNRGELIHLLESRSVALDDRSDAELIAASYALWGDDCVAHILGDFAFVVWDEQKQRLLGARDPMGMRAFVYHLNARSLLCASEPKQLLQDPSVSTALNDMWVSSWTVEAKGHWEGTVFRDIQDLPPGHTIAADGQGVRVAPYWRPSPRETIRYRRQQDYVHHFRDLFVEAVRCRLRSDQPLLFDLSGGLDSSSVVCAAGQIWAKERRAPPLYCLHEYSEQYPLSDDRSYARLVSTSYPVEISYSPLDRNLLLDGAFEPREWTNAPNYTVLLWRQLRQAQWRLMSDLGARVLLTGCMGDGLMCARHTYVAQYLSEMRPLALVRELQRWRRVHGHPVPHTLYHWAVRPLLRRHHREGLSPASAPWITPLAWRNWKERRSADEAYFRRECPDPLARELFRMIRHHAPDDCSMQSDDALPAGVELREPFVDRRLVDFLLAVPPEYQIRPDQPRYLVRAAMEGILPDPIRRRKDKASPSPLSYRGIAKHASRLCDLAEQTPAVLLPYLDPKRLCEKIARVAQGEQARTQPLFGALTLLVWAHWLPWAGGALPAASAQRRSGPQPRQDVLGPSRHEV